LSISFAYFLIGLNYCPAFNTIVASVKRPFLHGRTTSRGVVKAFDEARWYTTARGTAA
jgi:hypothetical protein